MNGINKRKMIWFLWISLVGGYILLNDHEKIPILMRLSETRKGQYNTLKNEYIENHDKLGGYDQRFPGKKDVDEYLLLKIKKTLDQLELLRILENPGIGFRFKEVQLEQYELLYGEGESMKPNITAGGLFQDFYYQFDI